MIAISVAQLSKMAEVSQKKNTAQKGVKYAGFVPNWSQRHAQDDGLCNLVSATFIIFSRNIELVGGKRLKPQFA